ncbi:MAG: hypothetical protein KA184_00175 [Candidatus Hydrogenedentes bacterium]|nr:hypothetical protein [Candidatus Hydrogenedentota bacterium]
MPDLIRRNFDFVSLRSVLAAPALGERLLSMFSRSQDARQEASRFISDLFQKGGYSLARATLAYIELSGRRDHPGTLAEHSLALDFMLELRTTFRGTVFIEHFDEISRTAKGIAESLHSTAISDAALNLFRELTRGEVNKAVQALSRAWRSIKQPQPVGSPERRAAAGKLRNLLSMVSRFPEEEQNQMGVEEAVAELKAYEDSGIDPEESTSAQLAGNNGERIEERPQELTGLQSMFFFGGMLFAVTVAVVCWWKLGLGLITSCWILLLTFVLFGISIPMFLESPSMSQADEAKGLLWGSIAGLAVTGLTCSIGLGMFWCLGLSICAALAVLGFLFSGSAER